jgi:DNA-binding IclR family transcriptional regulator
MATEPKEKKGKNEPNAVGLNSSSNKDVRGAALINKACDILDLVGTAPGKLSARELGERTGLPQSTVYRIIAALNARGFIRMEQGCAGPLLGFHFLDLAQNVWAKQDLASIAADELRRLREITGETTYLGTLIGHEMVSLARSLGTHAKRSAGDIGGTNPVHCSSQGKALLAFLPSQQQEHLLSTLELTQRTPHTIVEKNALRLSLNIIRQRGFAVDDQENAKGMRCIGVPILDVNGNAVAAISIAGPTYRMTKERIEQLAPEVMETGRAISLLVQNHKSRAEHSSEVSVTPLGDALFFGDKPQWIEAENCMYWVDRLAPTVYAMRIGEHPQPIGILPGPIVEVVPVSQGGIEIVSEGCWYHAEIDVGCRQIDRPYWKEYHALCVAKNGQFWACKHQDDQTRIGTLSFDGGFVEYWSVSREIDAMLWSHSGRFLHALSRDEGLIYQMRRGRDAPLILGRIPRGSGNPCALTMETGEIEEVLPLPVPHPTGLVFAGEDLNNLYITSARLGVGRDVIGNAKLSGFTLCTNMSTQLAVKNLK